MNIQTNAPLLAAPFRCIKKAIGQLLSAGWVVVALVSLSGVGNCRAQQVEAEPASVGFLSARPGFYFSIGGTGTDLRLDLDDPGFFESLGFELDPTGKGGELMVGWAFGRGFALELGLVNTRHETGRSDIDALFSRLQLEAVAPLMRTGRLQPFLAGGLGAAGLVFAGSGITNTLISGSRIGFGGGIDLHLLRRLALSLGYRYEIVNFKRKTFESADGQSRTDFRGNATANLWTLRLMFSL